ncbi:hypothetical protein D9757_010659 [Collybiopsis confluens]|uniref:Uncharacterized protein n=1 Tax=Collybiopsis confluens TaxID=2823264 RepID=A0A8H5GMB6_9AGAR|nr:hypothetical protein D9757_010659 [Collybiopsis confluens]
MSSHSPVGDGDFTPIHLSRPRQRPRLYPRLLLKWLYALVHGILLLIGSSVVLRSLWSSMDSLFSEANTAALDPYQAISQNQTLDMVEDRSTVVQPLLNEDHMFDIGVIIWAESTSAEEEDDQQLRTEMNNGVWVSAFTTPFRRRWFSSFSTTRFFSKGWVMIHDDDVFVPLYSDVPFRRLLLSDVASATVNFTVAGKYLVDRDTHAGPGRRRKLRFREQARLKASFHILPTSASSLDNVRFVSNWLHEDAKPPRNLRSGTDTIADEAISYLSFVAPLTKNLQLSNPCYNVTGVDTQTNAFSEWPRINSEHIITHTHIRNVRETRIMNYNLFNESHVALKRHKCGECSSYNESRDLDSFVWSHRDKSEKKVTTCTHEYETTGIIETLFEMGVALEDGSTRTEWAYAPFFESSDIDLGPKDSVPIPQKLNCSRNPFEVTSDDEPVEIPEALNISWHITYSSVTPAKKRLLDSWGLLSSRDDEVRSESEYMQIKGQDKVDQTNSLIGVHRHDSAHPWRRLILSVSHTVLSNIAVAFDVIYWYTRSETAFISVPGTLLLALAKAIDFDIILRGKDAWSSYLFLVSKERYLAWGQGIKQVRSLFRLLRALLTVFLPLQTIWMLMTALRIELVWPSGSEATFFGKNLPSFRRMLPTHRERASDRLERSTLGWKARMMVVIGLFIAYHAMLPHLPNIIDPLHPPPDPSVLTERMLYKDLILKESIVDPLFVSGSVFQILLNNASGYFGGSYKIAAVLKGLALTVNIFQFVPFLVGLPESRGGIDAPFMIYAGVIVIQVWQAITLSRVPVVDDKENEE